MANNSSTVDIYAIFIIFLNYAVAELYKVTTRTHTDWWVYADTPLLAMGGGGAMMEVVEVTSMVSTVLETVSTLSCLPWPRSLSTTLVSTLLTTISGVALSPSLPPMWSLMLSRVMSPLTSLTVVSS